MAKSFASCSIDHARGVTFPEERLPTGVRSVYMALSFMTLPYEADTVI